MSTARCVPQTYKTNTKSLIIRVFVFLEGKPGDGHGLGVVVLRNEAHLRDLSAQHSAAKSKMEPWQFWGLLKARGPGA